eukprot:763718-Hanusia_phi.AAC.2
MFLSTPSPSKKRLAPEESYDVLLCCHIKTHVSKTAQVTGSRDIPGMGTAERNLTVSSPVDNILGRRKSQ